METAAYIDTLESEGAALLAAAERAGPDAEVPSCPGWRVRDLLLHTGNVHRWAGGYVAEARAEPRPIDEESVTDAELAAWFRDGHRRLTGCLREAREDLECWSFLDGSPSARAFWARRQAHETCVHRVDAELAAGAELGPVTAEFAADGIDELLTGFHTRPRSRVRSERPVTLAVRASDLPGGAWTVRMSQLPPVVERGADGETDCRLSGPAATLYLALWNRLPYGDGVRIEGDASVATLWQQTSAIG
ncbi:maleylpyruvate isomerase family mycothiol-dependent enzyme [Streptomyces sp. DSM 42041]|uniref:Maleylpyruvate isomerase family mycothiol-dependent enzyme n=1 Tax=Streptomyces hazeniae TaxID=3075538 RepID=A0ABU2NW45_9ACTN|nr:maleylpyruvate isomerase family mycothiol-dependent enzyme [Streptomyces sp. DSM 42041]MDT0381211.1 maleylpyruvate isomerase family mycothiol-dependent enzyme [Streptomyces sp. DSM 42041]